MRLTLLTLLGLLAFAAAWTKEDHEIFRLKDELEASEGTGVSFYDFLSVSPSASQEEINKAYRKKSKLLHPDKAKQSFIASRANSASASARSASKSASSASKAASKAAPKPTSHVAKPPTQREIQRATKAASERFTRLGLITNILRGSGRKRYDHFLSNGFPAWRGADYYYSRFRPGLGSVLLGLFLFAGGAVHYGILVLGAKRQRDFVERYIRQARTLAWGDASPIAAIPGVDNAGQPAAVASGSNGAAAGDESSSVQTLNRRERRAQEKAGKRPSAASRRAASRGASGTSTPTTGGGGGSNGETDGVVSGQPLPGPKKRVQAENGKILVVDSAGNVFLEEENEETGKQQLFLLDPNEVLAPSFSQTIVAKLPLWAINKVKVAVFGDKSAERELASGGFGGRNEAGEELDGFVKVEGEEEELLKGVESGASAAAEKKQKKKNKSR